MIPIRIVESNPLLNAALRQMVEQELDFQLKDEPKHAATEQRDKPSPQTTTEQNGRTVTLLGLDDENPLPRLDELRRSESDEEEKVIVLTNSRDRRLTKIAFESGADGIASKATRPQDLAALIRSTSAGYQSIPKVKDECDPFFLLNDTEEDIVRLTCLGLQRREVAEALSLSEGTIKRYVGHILALTEYDSISHLAMDMVAQGSIHPKLTWVSNRDAITRKAENANEAEGAGTAD